MSMKTSFFFGCLLLLLNGALAGNGRRYHHRHNFYRQYHHHDYEDYDISSDEGPYSFNFGFLGPGRPHGPPPGRPHGPPPGRPHGPPPGHLHGPNPCDFVPPGHRNKDNYEFLPPGQQKKRPPHAGNPHYDPLCPFTPGPSFELPPTQPPSFIDVRPPPASNNDVNKDFSFPIVREVIDERPYHIHGYTEDEFPIILLHKSDIRK